jgi:hypothetical protein
MQAVLCPPGSHEKVYGGVPPPAIAQIEPLQEPLQVGLVVVVITLRGVGCAMLTLALEMHPLASVIVTLYTPAQSPVMAGVVCPPGFHK